MNQNPSQYYFSWCFCGLFLLCMFQNLKKQHVALSEQVKLAFESFPGLDFLKSVQLIGKPLTYA